jgi:cold-inducible RNA-binding protein
MNIYVGNLAYSTTEEGLRAVFAAHGAVTSVKLVMDRETGRPRGFGFVEMADDEEGRAAIQAVDGMKLDGRALRVNEARPREGGGRGGPGARGPRGDRSDRPERSTERVQRQRREDW